MLCESLSATFTVPDDELFVGAVVRMTSMRDSPCGVRLVRLSIALVHIDHKCQGEFRLWFDETYQNSSHQ